MIAPVPCQCRQVSPARWHHLFLSMLPTIKRHVEYAFQHLRGDNLDDAVTEVVANSLVAFVRLVELGKTDLVYPTVLARYGVAQVRSGRRVGNRLSGCDVLSPQAQHRHGFNVERLDHCDEDESGWRGIVVEDRQSGPADIAATRIDFSDWLAALPDRARYVAEHLAVGARTNEAAQRFKVSAARISQLRRELYESWRQFQGESVSAPEAVAAGRRCRKWALAQS